MYLKRPGHPYDSQQAGAEHGDEKRYDDIPDAPQGAGEHLQEYIEDVAGCYEPEHPGAEPYDFRICGKYAKKRNAENEEEDDKYTGKKQIDAQADTNAFLYSVDFSCSIILTHKCSDGDAESPAHHPEKTVHLVVHRPCRSRVGSKAVERSLDKCVGDIVHHRLESSGQSDAKQRSQNGSVYADAGERQLQDRLRPDEPQRHKQSAYSL